MRLKREVRVDHRKELLKKLIEYRDTYAMDYDTSCHMDLLIQDLQAEIAESND